MRCTVSILSAALLVSACATKPPPPEYTWYHPSKTRQQFSADRAQCMAMAGPGSTGLGYAPAPMYGAPAFGAYNSYAFAAQNQRAMADVRMVSIFNDCMMGQGWYLVPAGAPVQPVAARPAPPPARPGCTTVTNATGQVRQACD